MSGHEQKHDHAHDHKHGEPLSRRKAARHALKLVLAAGAAVLGALVPAKKAKAGYGACSISGCPCQGYMGGGNNCANCGHLYTAHW